MVPLPDVDEPALLTYHMYLSKNMSFPFQAEHGAEYGHPARVKVIGLGDPGGEIELHQGGHPRYCPVCGRRLHPHDVARHS